MRIILLLIIGFCSLTNLSAQDYHTRKTAPAKALKHYKKGQQYAHEKQYPLAIRSFEKALKITPDFIDAQLLIADAYVALGNREKAIAGFEKVVSLDPDYKPKVYYAWGILERKHKNYEAATDQFERFLTYPQKSTDLRLIVEKLLVQARFAAIAVKNPVPFNPVNMGENINSELMEYSPSITVDGQRIIYTVRWRGQEDFYIAEKKNGIWQAREDLGAPINTGDNEGAQSISADGRFLVYTACNREGDFGSCDLYFSELKDGEWTPPTNIGQPINTDAWESQPSISANADELYFAALRRDGKGKGDIWMSRRNPDGTWSEPENLGENINTSGADISPFIHPDGRTLYFISDGHPGMGKSDIYLSRRQADGTWGKAKNLGYPINTEEKEFSLIVSTDGKTAYFSSDRENGFGLVDLYQFDLYADARPAPVTYAKATVFDAETKQPIRANVQLIDLATDNTQTESITDEKGEFLVVLPSGTDFALNVNKQGYLFHSENFALKEKNTLDKPYLLEIYLQKIKEIPVVTTPQTDNSTTQQLVKIASKICSMKTLIFASKSTVIPTM